MAESSGPISQGTPAERQFTDVMWRDLFGDEAAVVGDVNGTSYAIVTSGGGDTAQIGSPSQISVATVAGFAHRIPAADPVSITIPAAVGSTRTDVIALRYDPAFTGLPGPVKLVRIAGSSSAIPSYDDAAPGVEDLPLWAVTRAVGQSLSAATVLRLFPRKATNIDVAVGSPLPTSSPLATIARQGNSVYRRELVGGTPSWVTSRNTTHLGTGYYSSASGVVIANTSSWTPIAAVTATSNGGLCVAEWHGHAYNGNSGSDRTMSWRVRCDAAVIGSISGITVPLQDTRPVMKMGSYSSTPASGSHTWTLEANSSVTPSVFVDAGMLTVFEK